MIFISSASISSMREHGFDLFDSGIRLSITILHARVRIFIASIDHGSQFSLSIAYLNLVFLLHTCIMKLIILTRLSYEFLLFHHCYDVAPYFEPSQRRNEQFVAEVMADLYY